MVTSLGEGKLCIQWKATLFSLFKLIWELLIFLFFFSFFLTPPTPHFLNFKIRRKSACFRLAQRFMIKCLVAKNSKPCEICRRICDVSGGAGFAEQLVSTPEMVDSVNVLNLANRSVIREDIVEQLGISVGTAHKIGHDDLSFS